MITTRHTIQTVSEELICIHWAITVSSEYKSPWLSTQSFSSHSGRSGFINPNLGLFYVVNSGAGCVLPPCVQGSVQVKSSPPSSTPSHHWCPSLSQSWSCSRWSPSPSTAHRYSELSSGRIKPLHYEWTSLLFGFVSIRSRQYWPPRLTGILSSFLMRQSVCSVTSLHSRSSSCGTARSRSPVGVNGPRCRCPSLWQTAGGRWGTSLPLVFCDVMELFIWCICC